MRYLAPKILSMLFLSLFCTKIRAQEWQEVAEILPAPYVQNMEHLNFGRDVDIDGDYAVVGGNNIIHVLHYSMADSIWEYEAKLWVANNKSDIGFGKHVAIHGNTIVCGAEDIGSWNQGAAYVFVKSGAEWENGTETAMLTASDDDWLDFLGSSVSVNSDCIVLGAPGEVSVSSLNRMGSVYVYEKPVGGWISLTESYKIISPTPEFGEEFGISTDLYDSILVVGAWGSGDSSGVAYVYNMNSQSLLATLSASDSVAYDMFGGDVAIDQNQIVVGAAGKNINAGAAYVFEKPIGGWVDASEDGKLTYSLGGIDDQFGSSVAISNGVVVCGAFAVDDSTGQAYVFERPVGGWQDATENAVLSYSDPSNENWFGYSVAINDNQILSSALFEDEQNFDAGAVYSYVRAGNNWNSATENHKIYQNLMGNSLDHFGNSVAIEGEISVIGVAAENNRSGAVYVNKYDGLNWIRIARLMPSDSSIDAEFGYSVDIEGDVITVGSKKAQNFGVSTGSVYIYEKSGLEWTSSTETAKLSASIGTTNLALGVSVCIDGDVIVAGASGHNTTLGAVYVYVKPGANWTNMTETAILTSSSMNTHSLGRSVSIHNNIIVSGAPLTRVPFLPSGAAYIFEKPVSGWQNATEIAEFASPDPGFFESFGQFVDVYDSTVVISEPADQFNDPSYGSVFVVEKVGGTWTQIARWPGTILNSNTGMGLSIYKNTIAVAIAPPPGQSSGNIAIYENDGSGWTDSTESTLIDASYTTVLSGFSFKPLDLSDNYIITGDPNFTANCMESGRAKLFQKTNRTYLDEVSCGPYTASSGATITQNGTYLDTLLAQNGLDSVLVLELTIGPSTLDLSSVTTDESNSGNDGLIQVSSASGLSGLTFSIDGMAYQDSGSFTNLTGGSYVVYAMDTIGCQDSIEVVLNSRVGISSNGNIKTIVYPNPSSGQLFIQSEKTPLMVEVFDIEGSLVSKNETADHKMMLQLKPGIYFLKVTTSNLAYSEFTKLIVK